MRCTKQWLELHKIITRLIMTIDDLWIAATSSAYNLTLVTTDQDFEYLESKYLTLHIVDLDSYKDIWHMRHPNLVLPPGNSRQ